MVGRNRKKVNNEKEQTNRKEKSFKRSVLQ